MFTVDTFYWAIAILVSLVFILSNGKSNKAIKKQIEKERARAMRPAPPKKIQTKIPEEGQIVFGKFKRKYIVGNTEKDGHYLVIGGSGSGKSSSFVIPFLANNPKISVLCMDIKGELFNESRRKNDRNTVVFSPTDHSSYGFDPFFNISDNSSQQDVFETMRSITFSLIPLVADKDQIWCLSARNLLIGLMIHYWNSGIRDFLEIIDSVVGIPIEEQVSAAISNEKKGSFVLNHLNQFEGLNSDTLTSAYLTLDSCLTCFSDENLRFAFSYAQKKCSPLSLEEGKSIFLSIPENKFESCHSDDTKTP